MLLDDLRQDVGQYRTEIEHEMRRMVEVAEAGGTLDLTRFGELASLIAFIVAIEATCAAIQHHETKEGVTV